MKARERWSNLTSKWRELSYYQRFESFLTHLLTAVIGIIALDSFGHFIVDVFQDFLIQGKNPLEDGVYQKTFGEMMILLIALEFNHTLQLVARREESLIQARIVILIALLALARKVIILNLKEISPEHLFALAAITLSLGLCYYWLVRFKEEDLAHKG